MNETMLRRYAAAWKWARVVFAVLAIGGSAIAFCPVWWGNDWSEASVLAWFGGVFGIALVVWLCHLSQCLSAAGHEIHAALVLGLLLPLTSHREPMSGIHATEAYPATLQGVLDRYLWGYPGLAILASLLVLAIISTIGRKTSWKCFPTLGPERKPNSTSDSLSPTASEPGRVDGMADAAR